MFYRQELCDLGDPVEGKICLKVAGMSMRNSEWTLTGGLASNHFFDIDNYLLSEEDAGQLANLLARKIDFLAKKIGFDKVAVIEKVGPGPIGLIGITYLLKPLISKGIVIVRPRKKLLLAAIKGNFRKGDRLLILTDVATGGWTIFGAAQKIWDAGGQVPAALAVIDRDQGAVVNLGRKGIELFSLFSAKTMREEKGEELKKDFRMVIEDRFSPELEDFGGKSATSVF
jgi:orotate phosphoribosyltransferase